MDDRWCTDDARTNRSSRYQRIAMRSPSRYRREERLRRCRLFVGLRNRWKTDERFAGIRRARAFVPIGSDTVRSFPSLWPRIAENSRRKFLTFPSCRSSEVFLVFVENSNRSGFCVRTRVPTLRFVRMVFKPYAPRSEINYQRVE